MGYRVEYGPAFPKEGKKIKRGGSRFLWSVFFFLMFSVMTRLLWPQGWETFRQLLYPGDPVVMAAALETFASELNCGGDFSSALVNFCREIMQYGSAGSF